MAPVLKRPASVSHAAAPKKAHVVKEVDIRKQKCATLATTIHESELPEADRGILGNATVLRECFAVPKEERHKFQEEVAQMLGEVLASLESGLGAKVTELEEKIASADADKASREAAVAAATEAVEAKKAAEEAAHAADVAAIDAALAAEASLSAAEKAQRDGEAALEGASTKKETLETNKAGLYESLKTSTTMEAGERTRGVAELAKMCEQFGFDNTLMHSLKSVLEKAPDARGGFDAMCLNQVDEEFDRQVAAQSDLIANGESAKAECAAAVAAAEEGVNAAGLTQKARTDARALALKEKREASSALAAAAKALKGWGPEQKQLKEALASAVAAVERFRLGPLSTFQELEAWTKVVPTIPVAPTEEASAAEVAAAASVNTANTSVPVEAATTGGD